MRRVVAVVVLVAFGFNCAPTLPRVDYSNIEREYPIVISERVGEVIDAEEREQFCLLRGVDGFMEARFYVNEDCGYMLEIMAATKRLVAINYDENAVFMIREYIDDYESIKSDPNAFVIKWGIVAYDTLGIPITKNEVDRVARAWRAVPTGCAVGVLAGLAAGVGVGFAYYNSVKDDAGYDVGAAVAIGMMGTVLVVGAVAIVGLSTGCLTGLSVYRQNRAKALETIKDQRKPKVVE
jgi:hypothetical protein